MDGRLRKGHCPPPQTRDSNTIDTHSWGKPVNELVQKSSTGVPVPIHAPQVVCAATSLPRSCLPETGGATWQRTFLERSRPSMWCRIVDLQRLWEALVSIRRLWLPLVLNSEGKVLRGLLADLLHMPVFITPVTLTHSKHMVLRTDSFSPSSLLVTNWKLASDLELHLVGFSCRSRTAQDFVTTNQIFFSFPFHHLRLV